MLFCGVVGVDLIQRAASAATFRPLRRGGERADPSRAACPAYSDTQGSFVRQLCLGEGVDSEKLSADYADGDLHLTIPASPRSQPRRVEITHATGAGGTISGTTLVQGDAPPPASAAPAERTESGAQLDRYEGWRDARDARRGTMPPTWGSPGCSAI